MGMKHFLIISLKVLLAVAIGVAILHIWPLAIVPILMVLVIALGVGGLALVCLAAVGAVGGGVVVGLLAVVLALLAALSPILIPVALLLGIIWMVKRLSRVQPRPPASV